MVKASQKNQNHFNIVEGIRLNLINHVLALFRDKFACNTVLRNPVFRWESCKSSVWESVKKKFKSVHSVGYKTGSHDWLVAKMTHVWSMQGEMKGHDSWSTTGQNFQSG